MPIEITSTLKETPIRAVIVGEGGVGKSTFCASAPAAVFIAVEDGLKNIDARAVKPPATWLEAIDLVDELSELDASVCGTIVIDSIDWLEQLCWDYVCTFPDEKGRKVRDIEGFGYGKGYTSALKEFRPLLTACDRAVKKGKHILMVAHSEMKKVKNPTGEDYEAHAIKLQSKCASLLTEWADVVGFAEFDAAVLKQNNRFKVVGSESRTLRVKPQAGYKIKTRYNMPDRLPLDWLAFAKAVAAGRPKSVQELNAILQKKLDELGDVNASHACSNFIEQRGRNVTALTEAIATVDIYLEEKKAAKEVAK